MLTLLFLSWLSAQRQLLLRCSGAAHFANQLRLSSQRTPSWLWLSGNAWLRKIQRKRYSRDFSGGIQTASCMQVWVLWWTLTGLTSIKEAVFCKTDLAYITCRLHSPRYSVQRGKLIRGSGTWIFSRSCPACNAHPPYCHLWPVRLYNTFQLYPTYGTILGKKKVSEHKMCVLIFSTNFVWKFSHSEKNWKRYDKIYILVVSPLLPFEDFTSSVCCPLDGLPAHRRVSLVVGLLPWCL